MAGRPGFGLVLAASSSSVSSHAVNAEAASGDGCGIPAGGISPERTLRSTFSRTAPLAPGFDQSMPSRTTPATLAFVLWQVAQYWFANARADAGSTGLISAAKQGTATANTTSKLERIPIPLSVTLSFSSFSHP